MTYMNNCYGQSRIFGKNRLNLQMFGEGGTGGEGGDSGGDGNSGPDGNKPLSFDGFLRQEGNKAEFDRRVKAAVSSAVEDAQKKWKILTDDKVSEAEKLAQMSEDEKRKYLLDKDRRVFEAERASFEHEKLLVEVRKQLQEQALPIAFAETLAGISEAKKIKDAIADIKKVWDAGITEAVKAKARQDVPPEGGQLSGNRHSLTSIREMAQKNRIIKN